MRDQVFISYSHRDEKWLLKLRTHLKPFERTHRIQVWDDKRIEAGDLWREEIERALDAARVAVLLVTPNYLASDFIADQELPPLLAAAEREGLRILWVAVSASAYLETPIKHYQAANNPARPLDRLTPAKLNEALVKVCEAVRAAIGVTNEPAPAAPARQSKPRPAATPTPAAAPPAAPPQPPPPLTDSGQRPISRHTLERVISEQLAAVKPAPERPRPARRRVMLAAALCSLLVVGAGAWLYFERGRAKPPLPPLTTVEVDDEFINAEKWTVPPTGWRIDMSEGAGRLEITNQPQVGYLTDIAFADFTASFNITLLSNRGAAWALRVNGEGDYYLFYLSGPDGLYPNRFLSYVVRDGKPDPKSERSKNVIIELKEGQSYNIKIAVEGSKFTHLLTNNTNGDEDKLGEFVDPNNTHPRGSLGFRTVNGEKFAVDDLFIYPPGVQKP